MHRPEEASEGRARVLLFGSTVNTNRTTKQRYPTKGKGTGSCIKMRKLCRTRTRMGSRPPPALRYAGAPPVGPPVGGHAALPGHRHRPASASRRSGADSVHHPAPDLLRGSGAHLIPAGGVQRKCLRGGISAVLPEQEPALVFVAAG